MKKLLAIIVLGLMWCNVGFAEKTRYSDLLEFYNSGGPGLNWIDYNFECVDVEKATKFDWTGNKEEFGFLEIEGEKIGAKRDKVLFYSAYIKKHKSYMVPFSMVEKYENLTGKDAEFYERTYNWFTVWHSEFSKEAIIRHILHESKKEDINVKKFFYTRYYYEPNEKEHTKYMRRMTKVWKTTDERASALSLAQLTTDLYNWIKSAGAEQEETINKKDKVCRLLQK